MRNLLIILAIVFCADSAQAQFSATKDAQYMATLKAVANYKIEDAEIIKDIEKLRENRLFMERLQKMLDKLSNKRTKDSTNRKVLKILEKAGEDIYKLLD